MKGISKGNKLKAPKLVITHVMPIDMISYQIKNLMIISTIKLKECERTIKYLLGLFIRYD